MKQNPIDYLKFKMRKSPLFMGAAFFTAYMYIAVSSFHKEWFEMLLGEKEKICIIAPRGHAKSVLVAIVYSVWRLLFTNSHYILLISNSFTKAQKTLLMPIKDFFETNKMALWLFGDVRGETWNKTELEFFFRDADGKIIDKKKIDILGVGQSVRGMRYLQYRPDTLIADDIEDDEQVANPKRRDDITSWFYAQVYPAMDKQGDVQESFADGVKVKLVVIGTILHYDSFLINIWKTYQALDKNGMADTSDWAVKKYSCVYIAQDGTRKALWDGRYTVLYWDKKREEFKANGMEASFMQEYMNEPMSDEERAIKCELLQYYKADDIDTNNLDRYLAVDLAGSNTTKRGGNKRDYNVVMVVGINRSNGKIYVLDYAKFQTNDMNVTVNEIFNKYLEWRPKLGLYEKSAQQGYLEKMVKSEMQRQGVYFTFQAKTPENVKKEERITQLVGFNVGRKLLYIKEGMKDLYDEMFSFPRGKLKDLLDTLAYAILATDNGGSNFKNYLQRKMRVVLKSMSILHPEDTDSPGYRRRKSQKQRKFKYV